MSFVIPRDVIHQALRSRVLKIEMGISVNSITEKKDSIEVLFSDNSTDTFNMVIGADVVGGIPWIEYTEEDMQDHIDKMFALTVKYNKDVSILLDDAGDPDLRTT